MGRPGHNDLSFDDTGALVPAVGFAYPDETEADHAPEAEGRAQILAAALRIALRGRDAQAAGRRLFALQPLLAEVLGQNPRQYREIAIINGTTPAAVSLLKDRVAEELRQELITDPRRCIA